MDSGYIYDDDVCGKDGCDQADDDEEYRGEEEHEKDRGEDGRDKEDDEEYIGEEGRGEADRTAAKTAAARRRTTIDNHRAGKT